MMMNLLFVVQNYVGDQTYGAIDLIRTQIVMGETAGVFEPLYNHL